MVRLTERGQRFAGREDGLGFECAEVRDLQETQAGMSRKLLRI